MLETIQAFVTLGLIFIGIPAALIGCGILLLLRGRALGRLLFGPLLMSFGGGLGYVFYLFMFHVGVR